jgi:hypothetical protein
MRIGWLILGEEGEIHIIMMLEKYSSSEIEHTSKGS